MQNVCESIFLDPTLSAAAIQAATWKACSHTVYLISRGLSTLRFICKNLPRN